MLFYPVADLLEGLLGLFLAAAEHNEVSSPREFRPRGSLRTVREPLSSYGSRHGATPHAHLPVCEQPWISA